MIQDFDIFFFGVIVVVYNLFGFLPLAVVAIICILLDMLRWYNWNIEYFDEDGVNKWLWWGNKRSKALNKVIFRH